MNFIGVSYKIIPKSAWRRKWEREGEGQEGGWAGYSDIVTKPFQPAYFIRDFYDIYIKSSLNRAAEESGKGR